MSTKELAKTFTRSGLGDFTAAGAVAGYYGLQQVVPTMPDLPAWAVFTLMALALTRGLIMRYLDGERLTVDEAADALVEAAEDGRAAMAEVEARTGSPEPSEPPGDDVDPPGSTGGG